MDYLKHYTKLIEKAKARTLDCYSESHHIIPRCMGGSDEKENLVNLTPEEHYVAHQLLVKIYPNNIKLVYAANMMCTNRINNKTYGWLKRKLSEHMMKQNPNKNGDCNRKRKGNYKLSEEAKKNISVATKGVINLGPSNGMYKVSPWEHPRATSKTIEIWSRADLYYNWWKKSGLEHGQNRMAREFNEKYCSSHNNIIKYFRKGWVPTEDKKWLVRFKEE